MPISKTDKHKLIHDFGFDTDSAINRLPRLIMAICAMEKCGKTTFGLSAPKPIAYFNFDRKIEASTLEFLGIDESDLFIKEIRVDGDDDQVTHRKQWEEFKEAFLWAVKKAYSIRTIVVDTESEAWELARLGYFGKLTQVMPYQYTELNSAYKAMLDECDKYDKNIVLLRKLKKQYKNDNWNGRFEPAGMGKVKDIAQLNAEMYLDDEGEVTFEILTNHLRADMNHETWTGDMCNFPMVAAMLTNTNIEDWE